MESEGMRVCALADVMAPPSATERHAFLFPTLRPTTLAFPHFVSAYLATSLLPMGRRTWATKQQADFLSSFEPNLEVAKRTRTLQIEYARISREFLKKWPVTPEFVAATTDLVDKEPLSEGSEDDDEGPEAADGEGPEAADGEGPEAESQKPQTPEERVALAEERRKRVS